MISHLHVLNVNSTSWKWIAQVKHLIHLDVYPSCCALRCHLWFHLLSSFGCRCLFLLYICCFSCIFFSVAWSTHLSGIFSCTNVCNDCGHLKLSWLLFFNSGSTKRRYIINNENLLFWDRPNLMNWRDLNPTVCHFWYHWNLMIEEI